MGGGGLNGLEKYLLTDVSATHWGDLELALLEPLSMCGSFWHYPHYGNQGGTPGASVRDGDWKLIRFFEDGHEELYNLKQDIGETRNLADEKPEKRAELSAKLTAWSEEIEALIPEPNPDYEPWEGREPSGHFGE